MPPAAVAACYPAAGTTKSREGLGLEQSLRASQRLSRSTFSQEITWDPWTHLCQQES